MSMLTHRVGRGSRPRFLETPRPCIIMMNECLVCWVLWPCTIARHRLLAGETSQRRHKEVMSTCSIPIQCQFCLLYAQGDAQDSSGCFSQQHNQLNAPSSSTALPSFLSHPLCITTAAVCPLWFLTIFYFLSLKLLHTYTLWCLRHRYMSLSILASPSADTFTSAVFLDEWRGGGVGSSQLP